MKDQKSFSQIWMARILGLGLGLQVGQWSYARSALAVWESCLYIHLRSSCHVESIKFNLLQEHSREARNKQELLGVSLIR